MVVGIAQPLGDINDLIIFVFQKLFGSFHTQFQDILIDREAVFAAKESGQIFRGKEIFFGKHGDLDGFTVVALNIFLNDADDFVGRDVRLPDRRRILKNGFRILRANRID